MTIKLCSVLLFLILQSVNGSAQERIRIVILPQLQGLPGADRDDFHLGVEFALEQRQDLREP